MSKKKIFITLFVTLIFSMITMTCYASDTDLYLTTSPCPEPYINYAEENALGFIQTVEEQYNVQYTDLSIGHPFNFGNDNADIYYFPIFNNNELIYLFRVYPTDSGYCGAISEFLVNELNSLAHKTSQQAPMTLWMEENDIIAQIDNTEYILFTYPENVFSDNNVLPASYTVESPARFVVDITEEVNYNLVPVVSPYATNSLSKYLNLTIKNTQGSTPWCATYVADIILRYIGAVPSSHSFRTIVDYFDLSTSEPLGDTNLKNYAKTKAVFISKKTVSSSLNEDLVAEIDAGRPVYLSMLNATTNGGHAIALCGYNLSSTTYTIWNPWYSYTESYSMYGSYVPSGSSSTIYNIRGYFSPWKISK